MGHSVEYLKHLGKRVISVVVIWNVVMVCLVCSLIVGGIVLAGVAMASVSGDVDSSMYDRMYGSGSNQLLSIPVNGVIVGTDSGGGIFSSLDGQTAGYSIKDELYRAAADDSIKGVILEIDSPGGTIFGSRAIADGVKYYKEQTGRPVYSHVSGTGASGAYWAAVSTDKIYVDYGSDVGSIGVILGPFEYYNTPIAADGGLFGGGVVTQNGIETVTLTAGKSKDVGNPYRRLTQDEISLLQSQVNNEYDDFVKYVVEHRRIGESEIRNKIGAMVYGPKTAQELKLSDGTLNRQDAYEKLAEAAKIKDDYSVVREHAELGFVGSLLSALSHKPQTTAASQEVDLCTLTNTSLAYHGDVTSWCKNN